MDDKWSIEKTIACLKRIVHPEVLPLIPRNELDKMKYMDIFNGEEKVIDFLKNLYQKSNGKLEIYGTVDEMMENIRIVETIPEFIKFTSNQEVEISTMCGILTPCMMYKDMSEKLTYCARSNIYINIYRTLSHIFKKLDEVVYLFLTNWLTAFLNKVMRELKGCYDLIRADSRKPVIEELEKLFSTEQNIVVPNIPITAQCYADLKKYFDPEEQACFQVLLDSLNFEYMATKQVLFNQLHAEIVHLIERIKGIFDRHVEVFTPFSKLEEHPLNLKPVIRLFVGTVFKYFLAHEVKMAIDILRKRNPEAKIGDFIKVESEEERRRGIVYAIHSGNFLELIEKNGISPDDFVILQSIYSSDFREIAVPIISSYGTHCLPAIDAFPHIIYYLTVILKVFQRSKPQNRQKIIDWIDNLADLIFVKNAGFNLIEIWKIDEIIEKARKELTPFLTEPVEDTPFKKAYTKKEVIQEIQKMTKNLGIEPMMITALINETFQKTSEKQFSIKKIYIHCARIAQAHVVFFNQKIQQFQEQQMTFDNKRFHEFFLSYREGRKSEAPKTLTGLKRGFLNKNSSSEKKKEVEDQKPSCSSENAENVQKLEEELENLRNDKNQLEKQIEEKKGLQKIATETSEKEIQKLRDELQMSQKSKTQLEDVLKLQLQTTTVSFQEKVEKAQKDLEKSKKTETQLEKDLRRMEQRHLENVRNLEKDKEKTENERILLKEDLEREKSKKVNLEDRSTTLKKDREDLQQKLEFLMSENAQLRAENTKNTEFQQKTKEHVKTLEKEHCDLVDTAWSRLRRLCSKYPDIEEAKNDVMKMEDCLDEYVENVKKEYKKLQD